MNCPEYCFGCDMPEADCICHLAGLGEGDRIRTPAMTPEQVIARLAEGAAQVSARAGVGGCETAGLFVSVLHANPDLLSAFLSDPAGTCVDFDRFRWENGSLSWHAQNGQIVTPAELRQHLGKRDN